MAQSAPRRRRTQSEFEGLEDLRQTIGRDAVLIPWPLGSKGEEKPWGHIKAADMLKQDHYERLLKAESDGGNIGVKQGEDSNNLCSQDTDSESAAEQFLDLNPKLRTSLITKGRRGVNVWVRIIGKCPRLKPLKLNGTKWGEWRGAGAQTIIYGQHPSGCRYTVVNKAPPVAIEFSDIVFPPEIQEQLLKCTEKAQRVSEGRLSESLSVSVPLCATEQGIDPVLVEWIIKRSTPTQRGTNDDRLFILARGARTIEKRLGRQLTRSELSELFSKWLLRAAPFLNERGPHRTSRPGEIETDYKIEFFRQYGNAKVTLDQDTLVRAWDLAQEDDLPLEALRYDGPTRMAVALCRALQIIRGNETFYVSTRDGVKILGVQSNRTVGTIFQFLVDEGLLELVEKGGPGTDNPYKSNRYRYLGKL